MALSEDGLVATCQGTVQSTDFSGQLLTGGEPMTEGRHYWEVEVATSGDRSQSVFVGAVRPGFSAGLTGGTTGCCRHLLPSSYGTRRRGCGDVFYINAYSSGEAVRLGDLSKAEGEDILKGFGCASTATALRRFDRIHDPRAMRDGKMQCGARWVRTSRWGSVREQQAKRRPAGQVRGG
jgi:hypothetical protein